MKNKVFAMIAGATAASLLVPLLAMQYTNEVKWSLVDFIVMGVLIFGFGSVYVLVARRVSQRRHLLVGLLFLAVFMYVWAELAVGVFTNLGN